MTFANRLSFDPFPVLTIVGVGLVGASVALAVRKRGLADRIIGVAKLGTSLDEPVASGHLDEATYDLTAAVRRANVVVLAAPVEANLRMLPEVLAAALPGTIVTDTGSTKGRISEASELIPSQAAFVGSHPMAGSNLSGWQNSSATLFERQTVYVTLTKTTPLPSVMRTTSLWEALGARVVHAHPIRHDEIMALVSHLPHAVAVAILQHMEASREDTSLLKFLAGNGLRDATQLAMGEPTVWLDIVKQNREPLATQLSEFAGRARTLAEFLRYAKDDELLAAISSAAALRQKL